MIRTLLLSIGLLALAPGIAGAQARSGTAHTPQPFVLPALPYPEDALEPAIDAETLRLHHSRHHKAYVDNLNARLATLPELAGVDLESLLEQVSKQDAVIRNNAGSHYNHSLFWQLLAPAGKGGTPSPELQALMERDFGSHTAFVEQFEAAARGVFGSGWVWLILRADGTLAITTTANQDNPLMDVAVQRGLPLLALDVWEHAYYLQYRNRRPDYISVWWKLVNWNEANARLAGSRQQTP